MLKVVIALYLFLIVSGFVTAQDNPTSYEIALARIEEARQTSSPNLDLSNLGLNDLPPEIGQLADFNF
jgi:hypothetical protein